MALGPRETNATCNGGLPFTRASRLFHGTCPNPTITAALTVESQVDLIFKDRIGENLAIDDASPRWCYYSDMQRNEALLFKTFDNTPSPSVSARFTIHSAFDDPTTRPDDPRRESIEARVLVIFSDEQSRCCGKSCSVVSEHNESDHA